MQSKSSAFSKNSKKGKSLEVLPELVVKLIKLQRCIPGIALEFFYEVRLIIVEIVDILSKENARRFIEMLKSRNGGKSLR